MSRKIKIYAVIMLGLAMIGLHEHNNRFENTSEPIESNTYIVKNIYNLDKDITEEPIEENKSEENKSEETFIPFFELTDEERYVVECLVMGEAKGESDLGMRLVAQCILDACVYEDIRPQGVKAKYNGWDENVSEEVKNAVSDVFDYGNRPVYDNIIWFYAPKYSKGRFHQTQKFIIEEGGHRFYAPWED